MKSKMNKAAREHLLKNQDGSIILIAMMVMMVITLIGLASLNSTDTDLKISQNDRCYKQNLYRAEAAALEAGVIMNRDTDPKNNLKSDSPIFEFLSDGDSFNPRVNLDQWVYDTGSTNARYTVVHPDPATLEKPYSKVPGFTAVFRGIANGESLDMSKPTQLWEYSIYGRSEQCNGIVVIEMGYRRRY